MTPSGLPRDWAELPLLEQRRIDQICLEFEDEWRRGDNPQIETYLSQVPDRLTGELFCELLRVERYYLFAAGREPNVDQYLSRFPAHTEIVEGILRSLPWQEASRDGHGLWTPISPRGVRCPQCRARQDVCPANGSGEVQFVCATCGCAFSVLTDELDTASGPRQVGRFTLVRPIGYGQFGQVWLARDELLDRSVAIKMPHKERLSADERLQFQREARATAQLHHPHIVPVHEIGESGDHLYIVSEYIDGPTLADWLTDQRPGIRNAVALCRTLAEALHHAHEAGIVHRDLKPSNILLSPAKPSAGEGIFPVPHIVDFGLAKREAVEMTITLAGRLVGTPAYMSPEQARGEAHQADRRSDIYALGVILFQLLTGELPFRGNVRMLLWQILNEEPPSPRKLNVQVPHDIETISLKCLEKSPAKRYQTAQELADDLGHFLRGEPIVARPISRTRRSWRWCQRNPLAARLLGFVAVLVVMMTLGTSLAALRLRDDQRALTRELDRSRQAQEQATRRLYDSLLTQAKAGWFSRRVGQRFDGLRALTEASLIARKLRMPETSFLELRNQAIACLALPDLSVDKEWSGYPPGSWGIDFDGDLARYVRTDREGTASVRRVADDFEIARLPGLAQAETRPRLSPNGKFLAVLYWPVPGSSSNGLRLWNLDAEEPVLLLNEPSGVMSIDFSPKCDLFAYGMEDGPITFIELPSGDRLKRLDIGLLPVGLTFHPSKRQFAAAVDENQTTIRVADLDTGAVLTEFSLPVGVRYELAWHPDGETLAAVGGDKNIYLWNVRTGQQSGLLQGHKNDGIRVAFDHAGDILASVDWNGTLRFWNPRTGAQILRAQGSGQPRFSRDGRRMAYGAGGNKTDLWEVAAGREYRTLARNTSLERGFYLSCAISPDGRLLVAAMLDGIMLWDLRAGAALRFEKLGYVGCVLFESPTALLTNGDTGLLRWPLEQDASLPGSIGLGSPEKLQLPGSFAQIACSPDGRVLASAQYQSGGLVQLRGHPDKIIRLSPHKDVRSISVSPNGEWVATGSHSGTGVKIWEAATGHLVKELLPDWGLTGVVFSPDNKWLATTGGAHYHLWAVGTWELGPQIAGPDVAGFTFSPDGKILAAETGEGSIRLIDPATGREYARLQDPGQDIAKCLAFTRDGAQLAAATDDSQSIHVWDLRAIRRQLSELGLDWNLPPYPDQPRHDSSPPVGESSPLPAPGQRLIQRPAPPPPVER